MGSEMCIRDSNEGVDSSDEMNEFRLDEQLGNDDAENNEIENIVQKKNLGIGNKEYKIYTSEFDETAKAETLENLARLNLFLEIPFQAASLIEKNLQEGNIENSDKIFPKPCDYGRHRHV